MAQMKQIHDFAVKWCDKFRNQNTNYIELVDHFLADDCAALGFEMDCGHAFSEKYGQAASSPEALERIIDDVMDIPLLGSAIYSRWRYFNHWAYDGAAISEPKNREWFILALSRLALISDENSFIFQGTLKKARAIPEPDMINKITLDYHRVTKITPKQRPEGVAWDSVTWDYTEHLIIDRETETLEHIQNIGTGCKVSRRYEIEDGVESLFEIFDEEDLFSHIERAPDDVIETPNETRNYRITLDYRKNPQRVIEGSYDKNGLPKDFADFAETIADFIRFYGMGEILDPAVYGKKKRRQSEYIFCSVMFEEGHKSYYYLTDDDSIEVGDFVLVPAGKDNHEAVVEIVDIEYFSEENVPLLVEKTKRIICKCTDEM